MIIRNIISSNEFTTSKNHSEFIRNWGRLVSSELRKRGYKVNEIQAKRSYTFGPWPVTILSTPTYNFFDFDEKCEKILPSQGSLHFENRRNLFRFCDQNNFPTPFSVHSPNFLLGRKDLFEETVRYLGFPFLIKHQPERGKKIQHLIRSYSDFESSLDEVRVEDSPPVFQKFIPETLGEKIKCIVMDGTRGMYKKTSKTNILTGANQVEKITDYNAPKELVDLVQEFLNLSGIDFGVLDILETKDGFLIDCFSQNCYINAERYRGATCKDTVSWFVDYIEKRL